jgi:hypothetical protein
LEKGANAAVVPEGPHSAQIIELKDQANEGTNDPVGKSGDDRGERNAHDERDGKFDQIAAAYEFTEFLDHLTLLVNLERRKIPGYAASVSPRPALSSIDQRLIGERAVVEVTLASQHSLFRGRAEGDGGPSHRHRLVGEATLRAVRDFSPQLSLDLSAVGSSDLGSLRVALAQVHQDGHELVGSAIVRGGDPAVATAKAVLDAVNRLLERPIS